MNYSISAVVAMASDRAIGRDNSIPWHLPEDMKLFKRLTMGHPILMGRKTWESLGRPLPGRQNIVLSRDPSFHAEGAVTIRDVAELDKLELQDPELMLIGGAQIYSLLLPRVQRLYVSELQGCYEADTYFPDFQGQFRSRRVLEQFDDFRLVLYER